MMTQEAAAAAGAGGMWTWSARRKTPGKLVAAAADSTEKIFFFLN